MAEKPKSDKVGWVCIGRFGAPVGLKGRIRLYAFTETPDGTFRFTEWRVGPALDPVRISKTDAEGKSSIVSVDGITNREAARALQGQMIYANRAEFPPLVAANNYYQADLVGLAVADESGTPVGAVAAFHDFGAGQLMEIALGTSRATVMVPFRDDVVLTVDLTRRRVTVDLRPWL